MLCLVRYLHPADHHQVRITKTDKDFPKELDIKKIRFPVKILEIHKIEEKNSISISVLSYKNKVKYPLHISQKNRDYR